MPSIICSFCYIFNILCTYTMGCHTIKIQFLISSSERKCPFADHRAHAVVHITGNNSRTKDFYPFKERHLLSKCLMPVFNNIIFLALSYWLYSNTCTAQQEKAHASAAGTNYAGVGASTSTVRTAHPSMMSRCM